MKSAALATLCQPRSISRPPIPTLLLTLPLLSALWGCASVAPLPPQPPDTIINTIANARADAFDDGLTAMVSADHQRWDQASCSNVIASFKQARVDAARDATVLRKAALRLTGEDERARAEQAIIAKDEAANAARYNGAITLQRCGKQQAAVDGLRALLRDTPSYHRARVALARYRVKERGAGNVKHAIAELERAVKDASFANAGALVLLANLQMQLAVQENAEERQPMRDKARRNLQRALAVDDRHMPAYNQLALYHLTRAKSHPDDEQQGDVAALEMAALVCGQALKRDASYAPIHNTVGLIAAARGRLGTAARAFDRARKLRPTLYEAHMNYAAVNLQFRGFANARNAYRSILKVRPKDYDAHIGLALALRGMAGNAAADPGIVRAKKLLLTARKLDPTRPESYLNEAILVLEFESRYGQANEIDKSYAKAEALLQNFMTRAKEEPRYAAARKRAQMRLDDIRAITEHIQPR